MNLAYKIISTFTLLIFILSCSPSIHRIGYNDSNKSIENCNVPVVKDSSLYFDEKLIVGTVEIGDPGLAINCGSEDIKKIIQEEACKVNADLIHIKELKPPDLWSSCYRLKADFIKYDDNNLPAELIYLYSFEIGEKEKYIDGVHIDSLEVPVPKFRASMGIEMTRPSPALNSYIYFYGIGLSYSYGISASTSDPNKWIKDINNAHHLKLNLTVASLENNISYNPIYIGIGKSFINEKSNVQGFTGGGKIDGTHYFIGLRFLSHRKPFFNKFATYFELGKSNWNYKNSILEKNNSDLKYNYSDFYITVGLCYYIF